MSSHYRKALQDFNRGGNSHKTAIHRKRPSAPARWIAPRVKGFLSVLDFGCGHGADCAAYGWEGYDPHWAPERPTRRFEAIVCTYVLNTVPPAERETILAEMDKLTVPGGFQFVTVRRDLPKTDQPIPRAGGTVQYWVELTDSWVSVNKTSSFETYCKVKQC